MPAKKQRQTSKEKEQVPKDLEEEIALINQLYTLLDLEKETETGNKIDVSSLPEDMQRQIAELPEGGSMFFV